MIGPNQDEHQRLYDRQIHRLNPDPVFDWPYFFTCVLIGWLAVMVINCLR